MLFEACLLSDVPWHAGTRFLFRFLDYVERQLKTKRKGFSLELRWESLKWERRGSTRIGQLCAVPVARSHW